MPGSPDKAKRPMRQPNGSRLSARALSGWRWLWAEVEGSSSGTIVEPELKRNQAASVPTLISAEKVESSKTETQEVFTQVSIFKIIAWLGGSAAGLTILLIAIGFLALGAHDAMLGIP